jgi:hypothetical protein
MLKFIKLTFRNYYALFIQFDSLLKNWNFLTYGAIKICVDYGRLT